MGRSLSLSLLKGKVAVVSLVCLFLSCLLYLPGVADASKNETKKGGDDCPPCPGCGDDDDGGVIAVLVTLSVLLIVSIGLNAYQFRLRTANVITAEVEYSTW